MTYVLKFVIDTNKPRYVTIRDLETKMVLGNIRLQGINVYGIETTGMSLDETLEDGSKILTVDFVVSPNLPEISYQVPISLVGAIYEDGTTNKTLTFESFNANNRATIKMIKTPAAPKTAGCHHLDIFQDGIKFNRIY